jgi:hypothetical protein
MVVWLSTDSQYVQKWIMEWMTKWKTNGRKNSKKAGIANKSLWLALDEAIGLHRRVEFSWVKAHPGLIHNEIADTLATRGVRGGSYCPTNRFDELPPDTEPEDVPEARDVDSIVKQVDEYDEDTHLPPFSTKAISYGFNQEEIQEQRDAQFAGFSREVLGNSSSVVSDDSESDVPQSQDTIVMTGDMNVVQEDQEGVKTYDQIIAKQGFAQVTRDEGVHMTPVSEGLYDSPGVAPHGWSSTFTQARREALQLQAMEDQYSWMTEADQFMFHLGLEPVPWEHFEETVSQEGETQFQATEQRASEEDVMGSHEQPASDSLIGATIVIRSETVISAYRIVSSALQAENATTKILSINK